MSLSDAGRDAGRDSRVEHEGCRPGGRDPGRDVTERRHGRPFLSWRRHGRLLPRRAGGAPGARVRLPVHARAGSLKSVGN